MLKSNFPVSRDCSGSLHQYIRKNLGGARNWRLDLPVWRLPCPGDDRISILLTYILSNLPKQTRPSKPVAPSRFVKLSNCCHFVANANSNRHALEYRLEFFTSYVTADKVMIYRIRNTQLVIRYRRFKSAERVQHMSRVRI